MEAKQTANQILTEALQRCIDEHGVVITSLAVTHIDPSTYIQENRIIDNISIMADII
jgi:hypothetical protein